MLFTPLRILGRHARLQLGRAPKGLLLRAYATAPTTASTASRRSIPATKSAGPKTGVKSKTTRMKATTAKPKTRAKPKARTKKRVAPKPVKAARIKFPPETKRRNAYVCFVLDYRKSHSKVTSVPEFARSAAAAWRNLSVTEKNSYAREAEQWNAQAHSAKEKFIASLSPSQIASENKERATHKKKGQKHNVARIADPRKPKHPSSAYVVYVTENLRDVHAMRSIAPGEQDAASRFRLLAQSWGGLSAVDKRPYEDRAAQDKQRYQREMSTYNTL